MDAKTRNAVVGSSLQVPTPKRLAIITVVCLVLSLFWTWRTFLARVRLTNFHPTVVVSFERRIDEILSNPETPLIDGHIDLPFLARKLYGNHVNNAEFRRKFREGLYGHVDVPRLEQGRVGGVFWSVYVQCPNVPNNFSDTVYYGTVHDTLQQIDFVHRLTAAFPDVLTLATSPNDAVAARRSGKIASFIGAEGLHQIGNSASILRQYYSMGVRYITLSHICNNKYTDGATAPEGEFWGGLSPDGKRIMREMNRIGMLVDLSHITANAMKDVLSETRAPVIFSHSSAYALCPHDRNVPDDVLRMVRINGGVVMVNFYSLFVHCGVGLHPENATIIDVANHMEHIGKLIGWEHVGIGSDFDGINMAPQGLEDVSKYPDLLSELLRRGLTDEELGMTAGGNLLRVWRRAEEVSLEMQREGVKPLEDDV